MSCKSDQNLGGEIVLTQTQIRYWEYKEDVRHHMAQESLTAQELSEQYRHNVQSEKLTATGLKETKRHNLVTERQENRRIAETKRHNIVSESLSATQIAEQIRHNKVSESLTATQLAEQQRHNEAVESETMRHNITTERETQRSNMANELYKSKTVQLEKDKLANEINRLHENIRHNKAVEAIDAAVAETQKALNVAKTVYTYGEVAGKLIERITNILGLSSSDNLLELVIALLA